MGYGQMLAVWPFFRDVKPMLETIEEQDFARLLNQTTQLMCSDGQTLAVCITAVHARPKSQMPGGRKPFTVEMTSLAPTPFVMGACDMTLADGETLHGVHVSRVHPLGRDPQLGYFTLIFN